MWDEKLIPGIGWLFFLPKLRSIISLEYFFQQSSRKIPQGQQGKGRHPGINLNDIVIVTNQSLLRIQILWKYTYIAIIKDPQCLSFWSNGSLTVASRSLTTGVTWLSGDMAFYPLQVFFFLCCLHCVASTVLSFMLFKAPPYCVTRRCLGLRRRLDCLTRNCRY